ncbi:hypothetical protein G6N76_22855 [Rhizobium daejeonense]|uniref:Helix-turn-helix transcriptional regulator n=1 Tax=Rhizobium daejeonense TaxID=240521 RepID=A0A6M1S810_9HYPH|nr:hypothetical protein [Rhizobium daejeonense]NGO66511.1 hypothetical protein [Rhizobium daejeonense]HCL67765.1 hypothetical protein [Rhizobium sp.]
MAIESAADLVQFLAEELRQRGTKLHEFSEMTGISEERLEYLQAGAWHRLTVKEIGAIAECLHVDFTAIWSLVQKHGNRMGERPRP